MDEYEKQYNRFEKSLFDEFNDLQKLFNLLTRGITLLFKTHEFQSILELKKITNYKINTELKNKMIEKINVIENLIETYVTIISTSGFIIINAKDIITEYTCSICLEHVTGNNISAILCPGCHKYIGHIKCVAEWLTETPSCPGCEYI